MDSDELPEVVSSADAGLLVRSNTEPALFAEIRDRHAPSVFRYVSSRLGSDTADDVLSVTFRTTFTRRAAYKPESGRVMRRSIGTCPLSWRTQGPTY